MKLAKLTQVPLVLIILSTSAPSSAQSSNLSLANGTSLSATCAAVKLMPMLFPSSMVEECALQHTAIVDPNRPTAGRPSSKAEIVDPTTGRPTGTKPTGSRNATIVDPNNTNPTTRPVKQGK
ncbi:MAG: hypothetical protein E6Q34_00015 [Burkholderiaceae bacterium]|nr:MAG: hypothetical protein E6Q34_00015 [Burkholderiaceae bacterium]